MKILLIAGHGATDPGAIGNGYKESTLTRELVNLIYSMLKPYANLTIYPLERNAYKDLRAGAFNPAKHDYALEVHFNAYADHSANGTEIYIPAIKKSDKVEKLINDRMAKHFKKRGEVKTQDFAVIKRLNATGTPAALLEVCFITNKQDVAIYQQNKVQIAKDIAEALKTGLNLTNTGQNSGEGTRGPIKHKVAKNETLWSLAVKYLNKGSRWKEIAKINPGIDPNNLKPGTIIKIPRY